MKKKTVYITLFTVVGVMTGFFLHMVIEIWYINNLFLPSYETYSFGLSWKGILILHALFTFTLFAGGGFFGFRQGKYWWRVIYIEKRLRRFIKT